jgi:ketosteroid isomerase-like protein
MGSESNLDVARQIVEYIDQQDRAAIFGCLAPEVEWHTLGRLLDGSSLHQGREEVWSYLKTIVGHYPGLNIQIESLEAVGEVVVTRAHISGEADGGDPVDVSFSTVAAFKAGKIVRADNYEDHDEALTDAELRL